MIEFRQKEILVFFIAFPMLLYFYLMDEINSMILSNIKELFHCNTTCKIFVIDGLFELENILSDDEKKIKGNSIFFIESHLDERREFKSAKQACSVESAGESKIFKFNFLFIFFFFFKPC